MCQERRVVEWVLRAGASNMMWATIILKSLWYLPCVQAWGGAAVLEYLIDFDFYSMPNGALRERDSFGIKEVRRNTRGQLR